MKNKAIKNKAIKKISFAIAVAMLVGSMPIMGETSAKAAEESNEYDVMSAYTEEYVSDGKVLLLDEESGTDAAIGEETSADGESIEGESTGEESGEETTTDASTSTTDSSIVNDFYRVEDGVLTEYLGKKNDKENTIVIIPKSVKKIADGVFSGYKYIETVTFVTGSNLNEIGQTAFKGCSALKSVMLPDGLKTIGYHAFYQCTSLKSIDIPSSVTSADRIFGKGSAITKVTFNEGMTTIPKKVLMNTDSVTTVKMSSGVKTIGTRAFYGCSALSSISLPETVTKINAGAFLKCSSLKTLETTAYVKTIGKNAFKNCTALKSLELSKKLSSIGDNAFSGCKALTVKVYANSTAKAYARQHNISWDYTASEVKRRSLSQKIYKKYNKLLAKKYVDKYRLKNLKNYVPQGICVLGDYVIVSMYYRNLSKNSILLLYDKSSGNFVKKLVLPSRDHVGSLSVVKGRLLVGLVNISTTDYVGVINEKRIKKAKKGSTVKYNYKIKLYGRADFSTYDGEIFWAGHSTNSTSGRMYGYSVTVKNKKLVLSRKYSYTVPANSQGLIVKKESNGDRTFSFTQSYGRLNDSALITYKTNIKKSSTLGTVRSTKALPAMAEGICFVGKNSVYIVFESAAGLYRGNPDNTSEIWIKNIGRMKYKKLSKLRDK